MCTPSIQTPAGEARSCLVVLMLVAAMRASGAFAATPEGQLFCGPCPMYHADGTPNIDGACVRCANPPCTSASVPVCYSLSTQCNPPSVYPVEIRGWVTGVHTDAPYPSTTSQPLYDNEYHFPNLTLDIGWSDTTPGTTPINTVSQVLQYLPPQNIIWGNSNDFPIVSNSSTIIWGGWQNVSVHVEVDSWDYDRLGSSWSNTVPAGWIQDGSVDAAGRALYWPFALQAIPVLGGGTTTVPFLVGTSNRNAVYVRMIGTLFRDADHCGAWGNPPNKNAGLCYQHSMGGCDYKLELHGVDSIAVWAPPSTRHTLVGYTVASTVFVSISDTQDLTWSQPANQSIISITPYTQNVGGSNTLNATAQIVSANSAQFNLSTPSPSTLITNQIALYDVVWGPTTVVCDPAYILCSGNCVDPSLNGNCGGCGFTCPRFEVCAANGDGTYGCSCSGSGCL